MSLLLDTHTIIWLVYDEVRVPTPIRRAIAGAGEVFASVVSGWEYELKRARHRDSLPRAFSELMDLLTLTPLDLVFPCHVYASSLPAFHSDPFDRMLIAQALHYDLPLVTSDRMIRRYPVETLW